jgi:hypothetical protein
MPATLKLPIVLNNFDFKFLYNMLISPYIPLCGVVGLARAEPSAITLSG